MYKIEIKLRPKSFLRQTTEGTAGTAERTDGFLVQRLSLDPPRLCHKGLRTTILTSSPVTFHNTLKFGIYDKPRTVCAISECYCNSV